MASPQFSSDLAEFIDAFVTKIRNNANSANNDRTTNSIESARETLGLAKRVIGGAKWTTAADLMTVLKSLGESVSWESVSGGIRLPGRLSPAESDSWEIVSWEIPEAFASQRDISLEM